MQEWVSGLAAVGIFAFVMHVLRYVTIAGAAFLLFWVWKRDAWAFRRIQAVSPSTSRMRAEFKYSIQSLGVFSLVGMMLVVPIVLGWTQMYGEVSDYGWGYTILSVPILLVLHDTYFYWAHRFMHWGPAFRRIHAVHHRSTNPSPWAAFAFHPGEALIEAAIIPILVFVIPLHGGAILAWFIAMTVMNVLGHLGYEMYPSGFTTHRVTRWHNTSVHHNQHHRAVDCNYGLYYNLWDRLMGTNHPEYDDTFEAVAARARG